MKNKILLSFLILLLVGCQKDSPAPLEAFSIPTEKGEFKSRSQLGKKVFLFFGFTHCPHVCPKTLSHLQRLHKELSPEERKKLSVLFVSVDTARDSMDVLKNKFKDLPANFYGAVDSEENLKKLMKVFEANYKVIQGKDPEDIIIDHTSLIYVINSKGEWVDSLRYDTSSEKLKNAFTLADSKSPVSAPHRLKKEAPVIGSNKECDLALTPCSLLGYEMKLGPYPITSERDYKVTVTAPKTHRVPVEVDFEGVETNMGLIRPTLKKEPSGEFVGDFYVPLCEERQMLWRARLKVGQGEDAKALDFYFKTVGAPL